MADEPIDNPSAATPAAEPTLSPPTVKLHYGAADRKVTPRRWVAIGRRWFRDTFSREQLLSSLRSLVWVLPLTVLIWIYAEREQVDEKAAQFPIEVKSGAPGEVARLPDGRSITVMATLKGPKARVGQAVEALQAGVPVQVFIGGGRPPGSHDVEIMPLIERDLRIGDNGLTVVSCEPKILRVDVDTIREDVLDVKIDPDLAARLLNGPALFDPPQVRVSAPSAAFANAKGRPYAEAILPPDMTTPGRHGPQSVQVKVHGLAGPDVTLRQASVRATVDVRDADERMELKSVPLTILILPELGKSFDVKLERDFILNVPVYGSPDAVRKLKSGELLPMLDAFVKITREDTAAGKGSRKVDFRLPEGIFIRESDKPTVSFTVTPDAAGG